MIAQRDQFPFQNGFKPEGTGNNNIVFHDGGLNQTGFTRIGILNLNSLKVKTRKQGQFFPEENSGIVKRK